VLGDTGPDAQTTLGQHWAGAGTAHWARPLGVELELHSVLLALHCQHSGTSWELLGEPLERGDGAHWASLSAWSWAGGELGPGWEEGAGAPGPALGAALG
jgi:hypothetical protein